MKVQYFICPDCGVEIASWDYRYNEYIEAEVCPECLSRLADAI